MDAAKDSNVVEKDNNEDEKDNNEDEKDNNEVQNDNNEVQKTNDTPAASHDENCAENNLQGSQPGTSGKISSSGSRPRIPRACKICHHAATPYKYQLVEVLLDQGREVDDDTPLLGFSLPEQDDCVESAATSEPEERPKTPKSDEA